MSIISSKSDIYRYIDQKFCALKNTLSAKFSAQTARIVPVATLEEMYEYEVGTGNILFIVANDTENAVEKSAYLWDGTDYISFMSQKIEQP